MVRVGPKEESHGRSSSATRGGRGDEETARGLRGRAAPVGAPPRGRGHGDAHGGGRPAVPARRGPEYGRGGGVATGAARGQDLGPPLRAAPDEAGAAPVRRLRSPRTGPPYPRRLRVSSRWSYDRLPRGPDPARCARRADRRPHRHRNGPRVHRAGGFAPWPCPTSRTGTACVEPLPSRQHERERHGAAGLPGAGGHRRGVADAEPCRRWPA